MHHPAAAANNPQAQYPNFRHVSDNPAFDISEVNRLLEIHVPDGTTLQFRKRPASTSLQYFHINDVGTMMRTMSRFSRWRGVIRQLRMQYASDHYPHNDARNLGIVLVPSFSLA